MSPIPDDELISAYLDDELSREDRLRAEQLLLDRADLRRLFDELRGLRQGLRSLPKFSLGDEFSSAVLRQAERSVLQGDEADGNEGNSNKGETAKPPTAESATSPIAPATPPAVVPQASQQQQSRAAAPVVLADRSRALRPIVYALTTIAAALAIMFYQQGLFRQPEVAMTSSSLGDKAGKDVATHEAPTAAVAPVDATRDSSGSALRAKSGLATDADTTFSSAASADRTVAPGSNATAVPKLANSRGTAATDAGGGSLYSMENKISLDKSASETSKVASPGPAPAIAAPPIVVPTPTVTLGAVQQVDGLASNGTAPNTVETVALEDLQRLDTLIVNSFNAKRADGTVDAVRLQEQLASVDAQQQRLQQPAGQPAGEAPADATLRKQLYGYGNDLQLQTRNAWSHGNGGFNGNGLLVINCTADRPTIEKVFPQVLGDNRVDDFSNVAVNVAGNSLGIAAGEIQKEGRAYGGFGQPATEAERVRQSQRELASRAAGADFGDGRPGEPDAKRAAGPAGRAGVNGQVGAIAGKSEAGRRAGEKGDASLADAERKPEEADVEFEYVRIVANEDQMKAILKTVRAEKELFADISVEGTPELYTSNRWREFGLANQMADSKSQAPASNVAGPSAVAAAAAGSTAGGSGGSGAPAAKSAARPEPIAPSAGVAAKPTGEVAAKSMAAPAPTNMPVAPAASAPPLVAPLAAATAAMPKSVAPAANTYAGAAPSAPAPAAPSPASPFPAALPPGAAPAAAQAPASPLAAGSRASGLITAGQPIARPTVDQPVAQSAPAQISDQRSEAQSYADQQRRGYAAQSRWQRANTQQVYERLFNERQLDAGRSNNYAVTNPVAEKLQLNAEVAAKAKEAGKLNEIAKKAKKIDTAPSETVPAERGDNGAKAADPVGVPLAEKEAELKQMRLGVAGGRSAPKNEAPSNTTQPGASAAKDEVEARLRDSQAGGDLGGGGSGRVAGAGFTPAPPMLPTQQQVAPVQQAAPEEVLGRIVGTQQPPPLVQQAMPALAPNRIRGVAQEEQAPSQDYYRTAGELPPDYQEALFVFRVVKPKNAGKPQSGEADAKPEAKPAK